MATVSQQGANGAGALTTIADVLFGDKPLLPSSARVYAQAMMGRTDPITAEDFSPEELAVVQYLSRNADPKSGAVTYNDGYERQYWDDEFPVGEDTSVLGPALRPYIERYNPWESGGTDPAGSVQFTLGQFKAEPTADGYRVRDTYDFNPGWADERPVGEIARDLWNIGVRGEAPEQGMSTIDLLEGIAAQYGPREGEASGIPVDFTVPYEDGNERDQMNKRRFIADLLRK